MALVRKEKYKAKTGRLRYQQKQFIKDLVSPRPLSSLGQTVQGDRTTAKTMISNAEKNARQKRIKGR